MRTRSALVVAVLALLAPLLATLPTPAGAASAPPSSASTLRTKDPHPKRGQHGRTLHDIVKPAHGTHRFTTAERSVPVVTGPGDDVDLSLATRLYLPDDATARHPQPAILMTHGFGLTQDANEVVDTARFFAAHGYVVLTYTASGFGASGGCVTLQSADYDVKSASQLIDEVLEPRKDVLHDRRGVVVGTIGGSYGGGIQLPLAAADHRVRATVVGRTWNDLQYSLDPNNRVTPGDPTGFTHSLNPQGVFKMEWTSLFYALGQTQPAMGGGGCPQAKVATADPTELAHAAECPGYYYSLCRTYENLAATGDADDTSRQVIARASAATFLKQVKAATLLIQGQSDTLFNENDAAASYLALKKQGTPVGLIWNSGGHGGYSSVPGECEMYDGVARTSAEMDRCYLTLRSLGWMDHYLRGAKSGQGPAFTYYRDWKRYQGSGPDDEQYAIGTFPPARSTRFTTSGTNALITSAARATSGTVTFVNPPGGTPSAYSETSNFSGPDSSPNAALPPSEQPGQFVALDTAPFSRAFVVVGIPTATVALTDTAAATGSDLVFFAKTYDVAPGGSATLIHRLISPVRVPAADVGKPVTFHLAGYAHRFAAGHRLRLVLASTDMTSRNATAPDVLTLTTGRASTLTVPGRLEWRQHHR